MSGDDLDLLVRALARVGDPPCKKCADLRRELCGVLELACPAFMLYAASGKRTEPWTDVIEHVSLRSGRRTLRQVGRVRDPHPTREIYERVFRKRDDDAR